MRWLARLLIRIIIFWAIVALLAYIFGIPALTDYMTKKVRTQGYDQCIATLTQEGTMGKPGSMLNQQQGENYCHCISDGLIFTKADLFDILPKNSSEIGTQKQPGPLTALAKSISERCNTDLQKVMQAPVNQPIHIN